MSTAPGKPARRLLNAPEAAAYLGLPREAGAKTLYRLAEAGEVGHIRLRNTMRTRTVKGTPQRYRKPGRLYFLEADLDAWLEARHVVPHAPAAPAAKPTPTAPIDVPAALRRFS